MQQQIPEVVYIIFTAVTAAGVLLQAFVLLGIFLSVRKSMQKLHEFTERAEQQIEPILTTTRHLLEDVSPKLKVATDNLVDVSHTLRHQANHVSAVVDDIVDKTHAQAARVDDIVTGTLRTVVHASTVVQGAVAAPLRQAVGVFQGLRAGFDVLRRKDKEPVMYAAEDGDHFV